MAKADQAGWHRAKPVPSNRSADGASTISYAFRTLLEQEVQDRRSLLPGLGYLPTMVVGSLCFCSLRFLTEKFVWMPILLEEMQRAAFVVMEEAIEATGEWILRMDSKCMS